MKFNFLAAIIAVLLGLTLALLGGVAWKHYQLRKAVTSLNTKLQEADLALGRANTELGDASDKIALLDQDLQAAIRNNNAHITSYTELQAKYLAIKDKQSVPVEVIKDQEVVTCPNSGLEPGRLLLTQQDGTLTYLNHVSGHLNDYRISMDCEVVPGNNETVMMMGYQLHMKLIGQMAEVRNSEGLINHYLRIWELDDKGNKVGQFQLESFNVVVQDETQPHFMWWAPHLDLALYGGGRVGPDYYFGGSVGFSVMGYGRTENDLSWRFLRLSGDFGNDIGFGISPVLYNLGELIPLISNLWVAPHTGYGFLHGWNIGLVLGVVL